MSDEEVPARTLAAMARCFNRGLLLACAAIACTSCTTMKPSDFEAGRPVLDPIAFFTGRTSSFGVQETRRGSPVQIVTTETIGRREGDVLHLEQDLRFGATKPQHRSWAICRVDAHHYEATANDIIGTVRGEAYGNVFHWSFTIALSPGNPLMNVRMSQWMYLQLDGHCLVNHSTIRKARFVVAQVTEQFRRSEGHD